MRVRKEWADWRPFFVNTSRCPVRRFSLPDAELARFSPEQRQAAFLLEAGLSVFVTGPGGTGKSELIRSVRAAATSAGLRVVVTASTGIAARNIGGTTLHRFAGMGLLQGLSAQRMARLGATMHPLKPAVAAWQSVDLLVVDEVSMLDAGFLAKLDAFARAARARVGKNDLEPFGGIQLLWLGDFAQLTIGGSATAAATTPGTGTTPTGTTTSLSAGSPPAPLPYNDAPLFMERVWCEIAPLTVRLSTIFRQSEGPFRSLLNRLRLGRTTQGDMMLLDAISGREGQGETANVGDLGGSSSPAAAAPDLCAFRATAARINGEHMARLIHPNRREADEFGEGVGAHEEESTLVPPEAFTYAAKFNNRAPEAGELGDLDPEVTVCVGARVLLTRNINPDVGLVNGRMGTVVEFADAPEGFGVLGPRLPVVAWDMDREGSVQPVAATQDHTNPPTAAAAGEPSEAIGGEPPEAIGGEHTDGEHTETPSTATRTIVRPINAFDSTSGAGYEEHEEEEQEGGRTGVPRSRRKPDELDPSGLVYMPLLPSWAITVHRAQGMTLEGARVHGGTMRTPALLYTALSRVRKLAGLKLVGKVGVENVVADAMVVRYYDAIDRLLGGDGGDEEDDGAEELPDPLAVLPSEVIAHSVRIGR